MNVLPEGGFDPTKVSFTPKWFIGGVCAVIIIMAVIGVGGWAFDKISDMIPMKLEGAGEAW